MSLYVFDFGENFMNILIKIFMSVYIIQYRRCYIKYWNDCYKIFFLLNKLKKIVFCVSNRKIGCICYL